MRLRATDITARKSAFKVNVLALPPAQRREPVLHLRNPGLNVRVALAAANQYSNAAYSFGWLRKGCDGPCNCRCSEKNEKFPPLHERSLTQETAL
jgi:hypothetical protein